VDVNIETWIKDGHGEGEQAYTYIRAPGSGTRAVGQDSCSWIEGIIGAHHLEFGLVLFNDSDETLDAIRQTRLGLGERDPDAGFSRDENEEEEPGPTKQSEEYSSYGASDGSCFPERGAGCSLTGYAAVKWTKGPHSWNRQVRRGALRNGGVSGHEANQSSTGEAAGLLEQLRMHTEDTATHSHRQQVDCKSLLTTFEKLDEYTEKDWVTQPDRHEWLGIAEQKRKRRNQEAERTIPHTLGTQPR